MRIAALFALIAIPATMYAQVASPVDIGGERFTPIKTNNAVGISGRTFTSVTADTTEAIPTFRGKSFWLHLSALDSASILPFYQLSMDGTNWTGPVAMDSLKMTNQAYVVKAFNLSAPADSAGYIRFQLTFSTKAYAKGTTTPTYSAQYSIRRN